jgi:hypothetical protein
MCHAESDHSYLLDEGVVLWQQLGGAYQQVSWVGYQVSSPMFTILIHMSSGWVLTMEYAEL